MVVGSSGKFRPDQAIEFLLKWSKSYMPLAGYIAPVAHVSMVSMDCNVFASFITPETCAEAVKAFLNTNIPKKNKL